MSIKSLDALGLLMYSHHKVRKFIQYLPPSSGIGILLDNTFSPKGKWDRLYQLLDSGKVQFLFPDLLNNTAVRNKVLQSYELLKGYNVKSLDKACRNAESNILKIMDKQIQKLIALQNRYPGLSIFPSMWLEHDISREGAERMWQFCKNNSPWGLWVDNPLKPYQKIPGTLLETHGNTPQSADSISNDGASLWDANVEDYKSRGKDVVQGWWHELNLNYTGQKKFIPPHNRTAEPTEDQIQHGIRVIWNSPEPKPNVNIPELESPRLWKVMAEDYKNGDRRGSRPLFICPSTVDKIPIYRVNGGQVGYLGYYDKYDGSPSGYRYYLGKAPNGKGGTGQTAMTLMRQLGSEWAILKEGNKQWLVNVLRRSGYFRRK